MYGIWYVSYDGKPMNRWLYDNLHDCDFEFDSFDEAMKVKDKFEYVYPKAIYQVKELA